MSISDQSSDAIHGIMGYLYDEVGQRQDDLYDDAWVQAKLLPVLTAMEWLRHELDAAPGNPEAAHPLACRSCQLTFSDVLQALHHFSFHSAHDRNRLVDVAMGRARTRPEILSAYRGDLCPIGEVAIVDNLDGMAEIVEVEGFVSSIPADCDDCRGLRDRLSTHIRAVHPKINPE
jgi:hypothetical protein